MAILFSRLAVVRPIIALAAIGLTACASPDISTSRPIAARAKMSGALPMQVPIRGVMAGTIDFSAYGVFDTATSQMPLTEGDWLAAGLASINLIAAATLITSAGTGPQDAEWVSDPEWRRRATEFQAASVDAGVAIRDKSRSAYLTAANRLARSCRSCHDLYRPEAPVRGATQLAQATH